MRDASTVLSTAEVRQVVKGDYALEPTQVRLMANGINDTYAVEADGLSFAFRVYGRAKPWIRGPSDLQFELDLLSHLRNQGAPISFPIERRSGDTLGTWWSPTGARNYALFSWSPGQPVDTNDLTLEQGARLGAGLASIHVGADTLVSRHSRYSLDAQTLLDRSLRQLLPALSRVDSDSARVIEECAARISEQLGAFDPGPTGWGVIHGDPQVLNCHFTSDGAVTFFDFDLCGFGWRAYDLAYCLRNTGGGPRGERIRSAIIAGYDTVRPLSESERAMLPILGQAAWIREGAIMPGDGLPPGKLVRLLRDPYGPWQTEG